MRTALITSAVALTALALLAPAIARADAVTDWNADCVERDRRDCGAAAAGVGAALRDGAGRGL